MAASGKPFHLHNTLTLGVIESLWGFGMNLANLHSIVPVFLVAMGASKTQVGLLPVLAGLGIGLPQALGAWASRGLKRKGPAVFWGHIAAVTPIFILATLLIKHADTVTPGQVIFLQSSLFWVVGIIAPIWLAYMGGLVRNEQRGMAFGLIFASQTLVGILGGLVANEALKTLGVTPLTLGILFLGAFIVMSAGNIGFLLCREPAVEKPLPRPALPVYLREWWDQLKEDANLRRFILAHQFTRVFPAVLYFYAIHCVDQGFSNWRIAQLTTTQLMTQALGAVLFGRFGDRQGHRKALQLGLLAFLAAHGLLLGSLQGAMPFVLAGLIGLFLAAERAATPNLLMSLAPDPERRADYLSLSMVVTTPMLVLSPFLAGWGYDTLGRRPVVAMAMGLVLVGWVLLFRVKEKPAQ